MHAKLQSCNKTVYIMYNWSISIFNQLYHLQPVNYYLYNKYTFFCSGVSIKYRNTTPKKCIFIVQKLYHFQLVNIWTIDTCIVIKCYLNKLLLYNNFFLQIFDVDGLGMLVKSCLNLSHINLSGIHVHHYNIAAEMCRCLSQITGKFMFKVIFLKVQ